MEDVVLGEEVPVLGDAVPEAEVETVGERYVPHIEAPHAPLTYLEYFWFSLLRYFSNPWAFLILLYLVYRLYRLISPMIVNPLWERYELWQERREQQAEAAAFKKDPDAYQAKMEAMEAARMRMQSIYDQKAEIEKNKRLEAEERKRQQDIEDWEQHQSGKGYKNRAQAGVDREREALVQQARIKGKKGYDSRPDDRNPLMGGGAGGSGYRPAARRGGAAGGG